MSRYANFPIVQPQRFTRRGKIMPSKYHFPQFDDYTFFKSLLSFETEINYAQKTQYDDIVTVYLEIPELDGSNSVVLQICDCDGNITTVGSDYFQSLLLPGNFYDNHGTITPEPLRIYQWVFKFSDVIASLGTSNYYFLVTVNWLGSSDPADTYYYISEPNQVKESHPNTLLLEYSHSTNEHDIYFALSPRFCRRIDGTLLEYKPKADTISFRDQETDLRQLDSRSYREFALRAGFYDGIPDYEIDKLRAICDLDITFYDGKRFVREEGAEIEVTGSEAYPLKEAKLLLCEYWSNDGGKFHNNNQVSLYELSGDSGVYPYAISRLSLGYTRTGSLGSSTFIGLDLLALTGIKEIFDPGIEDDFIDYLNDTVAPFYFLTGEFSDIDGILIYTNGDEENYVVYDSDVLKACIKIGASPALSATFTMSTQGISGIETIVSAYDGSGLFLTPTRFTDPALSDIILVLPPEDYFIYVYSNNKMTRFYVKNFANTPMTSFSGIASSMLEYIWLQWFTITDLDLSFLKPASLTMKSIKINQGAVENLTLTLWSTLPPIPTVPNWAKLAYIDFSYNALDDAAQDDLFNTYYNNVGIIVSAHGPFATVSQTPSSAPTAASLTARNSLTSKGWAVVI